MRRDADRVERLVGTGIEITIHFHTEKLCGGLRCDRLISSIRYAHHQANNQLVKEYTAEKRMVFSIYCNFVHNLLEYIL